MHTPSHRERRLHSIVSNSVVSVGSPQKLRSVSRNVIANYVSQFYVMAIGIVMAPVYLSFMGTEAYGLVGFFTMMTAWFQLLDLGLSATLVREAARFRGGAIGAETLRTFLRVLEIIFGTVSLAGLAVLVMLADWIAAHWLNAGHLSIVQVSQSVALMGCAVPLRWMAGLYRGVVTGFEHQVWLSGYNSLIATVRFVGVLGVFATLGPAPAYFFSYQLVVAAIELGGLAAMSYRLVGRRTGPHEILSWKPFFANLKFSIAIAFTATVWVVVTQLDKLVLSKWLTLSGYGVFSMAVVAAGAISALGIPFGQALLPRLTKLVTEGDETGVSGLYGAATQAVCVLIAPAVTALAFFAEPILRAWTGRPEIAHQAAPILSLYAIGNGWVALSSFAYYIQYAKGDLRLHFLGNAMLFCLLVPAVIWSAARYGAIGTATVWATANGIYALGWIPVVHARVLRGQHARWMMHDVIPIVVPTVMAGWLLAVAVPWLAGRSATIVEVVTLAALLLVVAASRSTFVRQIGKQLLDNWLLRLEERQT